MDVQRRVTTRSNGRLVWLLLLCCAQITLLWFWLAPSSALLSGRFSRTRAPRDAVNLRARCASLRLKPGPPADISLRDESDRFEPGTRATLIRNASIWTGAHNGTEVVHGDIFLDGGIVKAVGVIPPSLYKKLARAAAARTGSDEVELVDAEGKWITPGLVDLHSHVGLLSAPEMSGTFDVNSAHGPILPWLRSIDGFNTHDESFMLSISGGVTSVLALPGSGNAIGGQAFVMKLRKTAERTPSSMMVEPPHTLYNSTAPVPEGQLRWRHMKQACGENLRRYGTRMDSQWAFRAAYNEARKIKEQQDAYCRLVDEDRWDEVQGGFPDSLQWEMLVDVLRGRVKINNHCYEAVDFDDIVRLTNEFQFPLAAFHHASEAWLVPDRLKETYGGTPAIAIFATNHRYKRESYRGSEFAPRVLAENGIPVVMKSDHPVINSRYLMFEAQQAHHFGLPANLAIASVTSTPATAAGMSHRLGYIRQGTDADVVLWDSHPLQLGAAPLRVWIDGKIQIPAPPSSGGEAGVPSIAKMTPERQQAPAQPDWTVDRKDAVDWQGTQPLEGKTETGRVVFTNVNEIILRGFDGQLAETQLVGERGENIASGGWVAIENGTVSCASHWSNCNSWMQDPSANYRVIDLHGGSISPAFISFGSPLGIEEITQEPSTSDGPLYNPFFGDLPSVLGDVGGAIRAVDALQFGTRNALTAHRSGVTTAISSLGKTTLFGGSTTIFSGLSVAFRTGAPHALAHGAILQDVCALHVSLGRAAPYTNRAALPSVAVSAEVAALRRLLLGEGEHGETNEWFRRAADGSVPLVIDVGSADIMSTLLGLKAEVEYVRGSKMHMVFVRATESHMIADELAAADVGVILIPPRPWPGTWDDRRILPGPPLTADTALVKLLDAGVRVGIGSKEGWEPRNIRFDVGWAALESNGRIPKLQAYALASINLERLLGLKTPNPGKADLLAYDGGGAFDFGSKVVAVMSPERGLVELF